MYLDFLKLKYTILDNSNELLYISFFVRFLPPVRDSIFGISKTKFVKLFKIENGKYRLIDTKFFNNREGFGYIMKNLTKGDY